MDAGPIRLGVTIRQLSKMLGLSYPTVANILSGDKDRRDRHASDTQAKVLAAAAELGYLPNRAARAVKTGRFSTVALVLASDANQSYLNRYLLDGLFGGLAERHLELSVTRLSEEAAVNPDLVPRTLRERACDGLLVNITHGVSRSLERLVSNSGLPHVWINNKRALDAVHPDDFGAGVRAAEELIRAGHRRIAYVQLIHGELTGETPGLHYSVLDRYRGYEQAMLRAGLRPEPLHDAVGLQRMPGLIRELLSRSERPTGIVAYSDAEAQATYMTVLSLGMRVGRDVSLVTLADTPMTIGEHDIVTVSADRPTLGRESVAMLVRRIEGAGPQPTLAVPPVLAEGQSVWRV
jgi:LacI family transcriptional regulator